MRCVFLAFLFPCAALSYASDCTSSTDEDADGSSLLQARSLVRKPSAPGASEAEALLQTVRGVANSLKNLEITPQEVNVAVGTARDALNQMEPTFEQQRVIAQVEADLQFNEVQACHVRANMPHHENNMAVHHDHHVQCEEALATAIAMHTRECATWHSSAEGLYDILPDCGQPSSPSELFNIMNSWKELVDGEWGSVSEQRTRCHEAREAATEQSQVCASMTDAYAVAFCEHSFECGMLVDCHQHEVDVYNSLRQDIESQVIAWQQQYDTVQQANCILGLIVASMLSGTPIDDVSLTACDDASVDLAVTFRDPPPAPDCPAPQSDDPHCDAAFALSHSSWGEFTNVDDLQNDRVSWVDREYVYSAVPQELQGATLFSGPHDIGSGELTFHTNLAATLYIFSETHGYRRPDGRDGGFASLGWESVGNAENFAWGIPSSPWAGSLACWKREVAAMEDVVIPVSGTWVGGVAAQIAHGRSD